MDRKQCEYLIGCLLEDIRRTVEQYDPTINHISMSITDCASRAWSIDDETDEYTLKVDIEKEDPDDESTVEG